MGKVDRASGSLSLEGLMGVIEEAEAFDSPEPTGIRQIDALLGGGLVPGVYTLSGKAGAGKTALALQIAYSFAARTHAEAVARGAEIPTDGAEYVTLDIPTRQCWVRLMSIASVMEGSPVAWADAGNQAMRDAAAALHRHVGRNLFVVGRGSDPDDPEDWDQLSTGYLDPEWSTFGGGLIVLDYVGMVRVTRGRREDDELDAPTFAESRPAGQASSDPRVMRFVMDELSRYASERDAAILVVVELSKEAQARLEGGGEPRVTDTLGSAAASYAPVAMLELWRREGDTCPRLWCVKNRRGLTGSVPMPFDGAHSMFLDTTEEPRRP